MTGTTMQLVDWLDDLCVRFIINLPHEELLSVERICFQIEEAQWFYEDFIRPLDPSLPSMNLRQFALRMFQHCPLFAGFSELHHVQAYQDFIEYKTRVPVRGAIMLNEDMTHVVLVKGWKKGAKWSFPRGKINKDEPDLDCAVREVYEETGLDLRTTDLVRPESEMKSINVNMREQDMLLYVFRGVPMDTYFEPRTRKEISKIDWYKLTDLPTVKRKNQVQQGHGQDLIKENSFYMVAPFLGQLKQWIKLQRRLDRQKAQAGPHLAPPVAAGITDTEELEADVGETTADEAPIPESQPDETNFADLVARLGRGHRASDALPEVSTEPQAGPIVDPAEELKRLLSVGSFPSQAQPAQAPTHLQDAQSNPLLAMLHGNSRPAPPPEPYPRTPFEQLVSPPHQPHSPHGQHHPRPPHLDHMPPPPPFPFHQQQGLPFRGPQHPHMPPHPHNGHPMSIPPQFLPPPPRHTEPIFPTHAPNIQQPFSQQAPRPYQRTGDPQFAQSPQYPGPHGPAIPPASKLPPPKLTTHTLNLLNAFKMNEKPADISPPPPSQPVQGSQATPKLHQPPAQHRMGYDSFTSPQSVPTTVPYAPSPPAFQSPPPSANFQTAQPKPRSAHQDSLLNLFRSPSTSAATPPPQRGLEEPAELSALPTTPGNIRTKAVAEGGPQPNPKSNLLDAFVRENKAGSTSATIHGPVNAPDFDTMKKHTHHVSGQDSRGPSPAHHPHVMHHKAEQKMFIPQQILRRENTLEILRGVSPKASPPAAAPPPAGFTILKRREQPTETAPVPAPSANAQALLAAFKSASPAQPAPPVPQQAPSSATQASFDRRDTLPVAQKNTLLSLFNNTSQAAASPVQASKSSRAPPAGLPTLPSKPPLTESPVPAARSPHHPPTPKTVMSGVISPVSPLPTNGSQQNSPANMASRSRISSIGDTIPPSIIIPQHAAPTSHPATAISQNGLGAEGTLANGKRKASTDGDGSGKSPLDKTFLLGFLEDVARRGR